MQEQPPERWPDIHDQTPWPRIEKMSDETKILDLVAMPVLTQQDERPATQIFTAPLRPLRRRRFDIAVGRRLRWTLLVNCPALLPMPKLQQRQAQVEAGIAVEGRKFDAAAEVPDGQRLEPQCPGGQSKQLVGPRTFGMRSNHTERVVELSRGIGSTPLMQVGHSQKRVLIRRRPCQSRA